jgi:hypothetical protein
LFQTSKVYGEGGWPVGHDTDDDDECDDWSDSDDDDDYDEFPSVRENNIMDMN